MNYLAIKHLHMGCAALSGTFFFVRGIWMLRNSARLQQRWVKIVPHIVDTVLLASAIALAVWSQQYPLAQTWLSAKVLGLLVYIVLGAIALKYGRTKRTRIVAFIGALAVFGYIITVAITRQAFWFT
ncbi:MAG: SirB2 family protein [Proteobacteria bacterium]|nr:SirB2 family protein [Pseudomonadota bacterium]